MPGLSTTWLFQVHRAAAVADLTSKIETLRAPLPRAVRGTLTDTRTRNAQLLADLSTLNDIAQSGDSEPLAIWLRAACSLAEAYSKSSKLLAEALSLVLENVSTSTEEPQASPTHQQALDGERTAVPRLHRLLLDMFAVAELKLFISGHYSDLIEVIPWNSSQSALVSDVVSALQRHGYLDDTFFNRLALVRPMRQREIAHVQSAFES